MLIPSSKNTVSNAWFVVFKFSQIFNFLILNGQYGYRDFADAFGFPILARGLTFD